MTSTAINSAAGVENTVGTFTVALQVQDEAGQYGKGGKNNVQTDTFSITFQDTMKPVLECLGSGCAGTNVPASSGFNSASAHVHECATAYDDAAVGGTHYFAFSGTDPKKNGAADHRTDCVHQR